MKFYIYKNKTNHKEYTVRLLTHILKDHVVTDPDDADVVMLSICDIGEIGDIAKARKHGKPVLAGGMVSEYPIVNELADYVWHGEVYGLRDNLDAGLRLDEMDNITTPEKKTLVVDQRINWAENPIVGVGKRAKYYYVSKGCPVRCKYCLMGNARDYQQVPEYLYKRALSAAGKDLMPIAAYNPYGVPNKANIGEVLLKKYIKERGGKKANMIRSGVEFATPELSKSLAKGVTIDDLNEAIQRAGSCGTKLILYFIAGLETQELLEEYFNQITMDYRNTPGINIVFTYIDPQPFTPFHDFDLRQKITDIDTKRLYHIAVQKNKRIRILPVAGPQKSTIRSLLGRATVRAEYDLIMKVKNKPYEIIMETVGSNAPWLFGCTDVSEVMARPRKRTMPKYWESVDFISCGQEVFS